MAPSLLVLAAAAGSSLGACSLSGPFFDDSYERSQMLSPEPVPPYRRLVAAAAKTLPTPIETGGLAISEPRWIDRIGGPSWIVCLKSDPKGNGAVYYAFFIQKEKVVDTRTAIGTDRCVHQEFVAFDMAAAL
ncbi:hypothetical protein GJ689_20135 [Rhodoplanes serenus]|jgi:hypothetical protein|uniref:Lipoprotein n=1 Tax=Rhodoplanes serenus TaxID=200615 RepID=A0A9X5AV23_9BRAD|nr:hypothetical protein [Rhodoplanes serenus]MBI5113237.1 hypothetical protein [Rhodovulum sp.]MTW18513.1 hypothetical protein [Rhodoplanes serenus]